MKIIHVSPMYYPALGGAELHLTKVSEALVARGHEVTVVTSNAVSPEDLWVGNHGNLPQSEMINGVKVMRLSPNGGLVGSWLESWHEKRGGYRSLRFIFGEDGVDFLMQKPLLVQLIPYLMRTRADIVASWNWHWPVAYHVYLARRLRCFTLVGIPLFHTVEHWADRPVYDRMIAACNALAVNTEHEKEFIVRRVPSAKKIAVIGAGVDPQKFELRDGVAFRMRHALGRGPLVGFVGRMIANKGVDKVVEAMPMVWEWNKEVRLVLSGFYSNKFPRLNAVLQTLSPPERDRVLVLSDLPEGEKASLYDALDVFVLPSIGESFGIAYLEAWMCRKPVVGSRIGSTSCLIEEGVDGLLVEPNDPRDTARAIIQLLADPERRTQMGERGYAKAIKRFTWEQVTDRFEQHYLDLVAQKSTNLSRHLNPGSLAFPPLPAQTHRPESHAALSEAGDGR